VKDAFSISAGMPEGKTALLRPRNRREDNTYYGSKEVGFEGKVKKVKLSL
jgi:hypothetical protein